MAKSKVEHIQGNNNPAVLAASEPVTIQDATIRMDALTAQQAAQIEALAKIDPNLAEVMRSSFAVQNELAAKNASLITDLGKAQSQVERAVNNTPRESSVPYTYILNVSTVSTPKGSQPGDLHVSIPCVLTIHADNTISGPKLKNGSGFSFSADQRNAVWKAIYSCVGNIKDITVINKLREACKLSPEKHTFDPNAADSDKPKQNTRAKLSLNDLPEFNEAEKQPAPVYTDNLTLKLPATIGSTV